MQNRLKATLGLLAILTLADAARADEVDVLARNIYEQSIKAPPDEKVAEILAALRPDGSFEGIDYQSTSRASWQPQGHVTRLNDLLGAWCDPSSKYHRDPTVSAAAIAAYNHWVKNKYESSNWFYNQIGVPERLGSAMIKMQQNGLLPADNFDEAIALVHRAFKGQGGASTGANLASQAACTITEGVLRYRAPQASAGEKKAAADLIRQSYDYIGSTLAIAMNLEDDGIRIDRSYQSHEQSLYDAGYGASLLGNVSKTARWAVGTVYGLSPAHVRNLIDYILDGGPQWMVRGTTFDPLSGGRYWSRRTQIGTAASLRDPIDTAIALSNGYRSAELQTLRDRLADSIENKSASPTLGPTGNRSYWVSDYMSHHRPGYMLSVAGASTRTNTPESINGENLKAGYGTAGINLVLRTGREYDHIYPVWDWYRLPGTTSERASTGTGGGYSILPDHHFGATTIVGGASDGKVGAFVYQMSEYGIAANKSYFFFDRGEVALGSAIEQPKPNVAGGVVGTTINQTLLNGDVTYSVAAGTRATLGRDQTVTPAGLRWVHHDSVGYVFLEPVDAVTIRTLSQSGTWRSLNTAGETTPEKKDVFSLDWDHGPLPTDGRYAYAILPGIAADEIDALLATQPFAVLRNDGQAQAVTDRAGDVTAITFFGRGSVTLSDGTALTQTTAQASSVIWTRAGNTVTLSLANVDRYSEPFAFTVSAQLAGENVSWNPRTNLTTLSVAPATGPRAGSTVTRTYTVLPATPK